MPTTDNGYDALDGLRGVAAIAVMFSHFTPESVFKTCVAVDLDRGGNGGHIHLSDAKRYFRNHLQSFL
jgi:peptidoglycan/LPS O-acetylase OafA/YrhL